MTDNAQKFDLDTLTDDEVMKLDPDQVQALMNGEGGSNESTTADDTGSESNPGSPLAQDDGTSTDPNPQGEEPGSQANTDQGTGEGLHEDGQTPSGEKPQQPAAQASQESGKDGTSPKSVDSKAETKDQAPADAAAAVDFYTKVSAPFKADGKEFQIRSPEDAIRLMQMGVNYSRRMQEIKPLKAMDAMLKAHGLNDPAKLSFLIDVSKGKPEAIQKLLKDTKIDPIDLDVSKAGEYKAPNYQQDPKDLAFQEAIENTLAADGGRELIQDINRGWDEVSKEALRDQPSIFENILEQKRNGVYGQIKAELEYQRTMGFLTNVPFLQAYHQVGEAMQKAGVFGKPKEVQSSVAPIDTGVRKAAPKPKTEQPNPNLSSTVQPRVVSTNVGNQNEPDYSQMSDADFLKLAPPR